MGVPHPLKCLQSLVFPGGISFAVAITRTKGVLPSNNYQQHVKHELIIYFVYNGDVKADSNGARLPAWQDHQSAFIIMPHDKQTKLHFESKANLNTDGAFFL